MKKKVKVLVTGRGRKAGTKETFHLTSAIGTMRKTKKKILIREINNNGLMIFHKDSQIFEENRL